MIDGLLDIARDWKDGKLYNVHPSVGTILNSALVRAGETAVPFSGHTNALAPTVVELLRERYQRATPLEAAA